MAVDQTTSPADVLRALSVGAALVCGCILVCTLMVPDAASADTEVLDGMPSYYWWGGCSPTAGGMIIGYWNDPQRYPLYNGDATTWWGASYNSDGSAPTGPATIVASWEHVHEGDLLGYNTSEGRGHYDSSVRSADCLADFMGISI